MSSARSHNFLYDQGGVCRHSSVHANNVISCIRRLPASLLSTCDVIAFMLFALQFLIYNTLVISYLLELLIIIKQLSRNGRYYYAMQTYAELYNVQGRIFHTNSWRGSRKNTASYTRQSTVNWNHWSDSDENSTGSRFLDLPSSCRVSSKSIQFPTVKYNYIKCLQTSLLETAILFNESTDSHCNNNIVSENRTCTSERRWTAEWPVTT